MNLKIEKRQVDGVTVVSCQGRIMFGDEANALRDFLKEALTETPRMVLNLSGVTYIDSGGLGTLVGVYSSARGGRGRDQAHRPGPAPARCAADYQAGNGLSRFLTVSRRRSPPWVAGPLEFLKYLTSPCAWIIRDGEG